jgi:F-type H+-transporting ATPase subunit alpha
MYQGQHVLIIFDDLSKQAEAYRAISLLRGRRPAARPTRGRVLPALTAAGACAKLSTTWRRVADRAPGHRDRRTTSPPTSDQRHLHHRRADLPGDRPVQLGVGRPSTSAVGIRVGGDAQIKAMKKVAGGSSPFRSSVT